MGLVALLAVTFPAGAQETSVGTGPDSTCPYTACGLRLSRRTLEAGVDRKVVGRLGSFRVSNDIIELFARSDSATEYARRFVRTYNRTKWLSMLSAGAMGLSAGVMAGLALKDRRVPSGMVYTLIGAGAVSMQTAIRLSRARDQLGAAVWWYNRSLSPQPR